MAPLCLIRGWKEVWVRRRQVTSVSWREYVVSVHLFGLYKFPLLSTCASHTPVMNRWSVAAQLPTMLVSSHLSRLIVMSRSRSQGRADCRWSAVLQFVKSIRQVILLSNFKKGRIQRFWLPKPENSIQMMERETNY